MARALGKKKKKKEKKKVIDDMKLFFHHLKLITSINCSSKYRGKNCVNGKIGINMPIIFNHVKELVHMFSFNPTGSS